MTFYLIDLFLVEPWFNKGSIRVVKSSRLLAITNKMRLHYIKTLLLYFTITEANCLLSQGLCYVDVHYIDGLTLMGMILIAFSVVYFFPFFYGCCLMVAWSPEASTICSWVTKILNMEPCPTWWIARAYDSYGNSLYVSFQWKNNSAFPAQFILLKQKTNTLVCLPWAKNFHK